MMDTDAVIIANQKKIAELAESIVLWSTTKVPRETIAKTNDMRERLGFRLKQLEIQGQKDKIETMTKVLALLKGETV